MLSIFAKVTCRILASYSLARQSGYLCMYVRATWLVMSHYSGIFSMYTLLKQWHLRWLEHVVRMADGWIPKNPKRISSGKAAIQGYLQVGSEGLKNGPQRMGNLDIWAFSLEAGGAVWLLSIWRDTCPAGRGKEAVLKPAKSGSWTGDRLHLSSAWKGLSLLNWPSQSH